MTRLCWTRRFIRIRSIRMFSIIKRIDTVPMSICLLLSLGAMIVPIRGGAVIPPSAACAACKNGCAGFPSPMYLLTNGLGAGTRKYCVDYDHDGTAHCATFNATSQEVWKFDDQDQKYYYDLQTCTQINCNQGTPINSQICSLTRPTTLQNSASTGCMK